MLHMVISKHTPESCPGRPGNEGVFPCLNKMDELLHEKNITTIGKWADPTAHVNYLVLDAPNAHAIIDVLAESGLSMHTSNEIRPVVDMG